MVIQADVRDMPHMPTDVMMEIFSRVPARSVGRFRTLSKLYHRLLCQPSFTNHHLRHVTSFKLLVHLLQTTVPTETNCYFSYPLTSDKLDRYEVNDSSNQIVGDNIVSLIHCNGLFCIVDKESGLLTLWNPTTREVTSLPQLKQDTNINGFREPSWGSCLHHYFFGHDSLNDDYKIVCVVCVFKKKENQFPSLAETPISNTTYIYSHRAGCWKQIQQPPLFPPYCIQFSEDGCNFVQGKIHFVAYTSRDEEGGKRSQFIVSFDLAAERYGTVPRPRSDHPGDDLNVCAIGGELCFYIDCDPSKGRGFEMWMMRKYGVEQSWLRLLSIPLHNLLYSPSIYYHKRCVPLFLMKSGEILINASEDGQYRTSIYLYNPKNHNFVTVKTVVGNASLSGHIYVESLMETAISNKGQICSVKDQMF